MEEPIRVRACNIFLPKDLCKLQCALIYLFWRIKDLLTGGDRNWLLV